MTPVRDRDDLGVEYYLNLKGEAVFKRTPGGVFIVLEGPDGVGKTSQAELLEEYARTLGYRVLFTKEPTDDSPFAKKAKEAFLGKVKISPKALQELYARDRKWHLGNVIIPALRRGEVVICDRYFFTSFAIGSLDCNVWDLINMNRNFIVPDMTLVFVAKPETCMKRLKKKGKKKSRFENKEAIGKTLTIYKKFDRMFKGVVVIDAEDTISHVFKAVRDAVSKILR